MSDLNYCANFCEINVHQPLMDPSLRYHMTFDKQNTTNSFWTDLKAREFCKHIYFLL